MDCEHEVEYPSEENCAECEKTDTQKLECEIEYNFGMAMMYRNALIQTGCNDLFCAEYTKVCHDCPCSFHNKQLTNIQGEKP
jgi:hypothetical protein